MEHVGDRHNLCARSPHLRLLVKLLCHVNGSNRNAAARVGVTLPLKRQNVNTAATCAASKFLSCAQPKHAWWTGHDDGDESGDW